MICHVLRPFSRKIMFTPGINSRSITVSPLLSSKQMPSRPKPPDDSEFRESFLKGTGPGGQKIVQNKTNSAVQLKHHETGIVVKVQETRSRTQNRKLARQMLADQLEKLEKGRESRVAVVAEAKRKKKASASRKSRKKYRALEASKNAVASYEDEQSGSAAKSQEERRRGEDNSGKVL